MLLDKHAYQGKALNYDLVTYMSLKRVKMKTAKTNYAFLLRGMFFIIILCGLFVSMGIVNISNVKAQDFTAVTPTAEAALNVYQNAEFGFSFLYPETVTPMKWEPIKDILSSVSLFPAGNSSQLQLHSPEISITGS